MSEKDIAYIYGVFEPEDKKIPITGNYPVGWMSNVAVSAYGTFMPNYAPQLGLDIGTYINAPLDGINQPHDSKYIFMKNGEIKLGISNILGDEKKTIDEFKANGYDIYKKL